MRVMSIAVVITTAMVITSAGPTMYTTPRLTHTHINGTALMHYIRTRDTRHMHLRPITRAMPIHGDVESVDFDL